MVDTGKMFAQKNSCVLKQKTSQLIITKIQKFAYFGIKTRTNPLASIQAAQKPTINPETTDAFPASRKFRFIPLIPSPYVSSFACQTYLFHELVLFGTLGISGPGFRQILHAP